MSDAEELPAIGIVYNSFYSCMEFMHHEDFQKLPLYKQERFKEGWNNFCDEFAELVFEHITLACFGELRRMLDDRHFQCYLHTNNKRVRICDYSREYTYKVGEAFDPCDILKCCEKVFYLPHTYASNVGGPLWGLCAKTAQLYGKVPNETYCDIVCSLVHNGSTVFDKPVVFSDAEFWMSRIIHNKNIQGPWYGNGRLMFRRTVVRPLARLLTMAGIYCIPIPYKPQRCGLLDTPKLPLEVVITKHTRFTDRYADIYTKEAAYKQMFAGVFNMRLEERRWQRLANEYGFTLPVYTDEMLDELCGPVCNDAPHFKGVYAPPAKEEPEEADDEEDEDELDDELDDDEDDEAEYTSQEKTNG